MEAALSLHSIVVATPQQVSCTLGEEAAILNMKNSVYYGVNPVAARVWALLREPQSVAALRDTLLDEYEVEPEQCERDLMDLLEKMLGEGLIELRDEPAATPHEGLAR